eukprot:1176847-Prorocentrum_minimum.AAC.5
MNKDASARPRINKIKQRYKDDSHGGPIRRRKRGYILTADQSDAGSAGIFSRRTNQTQEAWVYSHDGPICTPAHNRDGLTG